MLVTVPRNNSDPGSEDSGNHALVPVAIDKPRSRIITNKYERSAMTALQNKEPRIGCPTSPTNKTTLKNSSCSRCWEQRDRIFKELKPDGLGESYSL